MAAFDWVRRMGVHEAYHLSPANRWLHWLCIPIELLGVLTLCAQVRLGPIDLAVVLIAAVGVIYLVAEPLAGLLMVGGLVGLRALAVHIPHGWAVGLALFVVPFVVQTQLGHRVFEAGVDDTAKNLAELRRTRNPVPIVLVFFYHLVEILLAAGYRPALRREIERHRDEESARLA